MNNFPVLYFLDKLPAYFESVRKNPVPKKFTFRYFASIGHASSHDRDFVYLLKFLGFLDSKSCPLDNFSKLRDVNSFRSTLSEHIYKGYRALFELDTNIINVSEDVLVGYFTRFSNSSEETLISRANTFKALCAFSGLSTLVSSEEPRDVIRDITNKKFPVSYDKINLSINLPTTTDEKVYESLFRHLKDLLVD